MCLLYLWDREAVRGFELAEQILQQTNLVNMSLCDVENTIFLQETAANPWRLT